MNNNESLIKSVGTNLDSFFRMHKKQPPEAGLHQRFMNEVEKVLIEKTLAYAQNVQSKASQILGINRNTLRKKIQQLEIKIEPDQPT